MRLFSNSNRSSQSGAQRTRKSLVESLEDRSLLSVAPYAAGLENLQPDVLELPAALVAKQTDAATESEPIAVTSELIKTTGVDDPYNLEYVVMETGRVGVLGQNGTSYYSNMTYTAVPDQIYLDLWQKAISRWEEVFAEGEEDVLYPYPVGNLPSIEVDDCLLLFGFTDSYDKPESSLGSAINSGFYRNEGKGTAATGSLVFNAKYFIANPDENLQKIFYNTALHEIGHSLGYNVTHFRNANLILKSNDAPFGLDSTFTATTGAESGYWYYAGQRGVEEYLNAFPETFLALGDPDQFPMETYIANGSYGAHPSSALATYYLILDQRDGMNYAISPNYEATITSMTLGVLEDVGYKVNHDFADPYGTAAPKNLTAETRGATVILTWDKTTTPYSTYVVERRDADGENWAQIATDLEPQASEDGYVLRYVDVAADPSAEYLYRVRATDLTTRREVQDFRVKKGDAITWDKGDASRFTIYTLSADAKNRLGWVRTVSSTDETTWESNVNYETIARVVALNVPLEESEPSRAIAVTFDPDASSYAPDGYSVEDWNALKAFLNLVDEDGVKNGEKIADAHGKTYSPDLLEELDGLTWSLVDGVYRATEIDWQNYGLVGVMALDDCDQLQKVNVAKNSITGVALASPVLTELNVDDNNLSTLDVSDLTELRSLSCAKNQLNSLELVNNGKITYFDCSQNPIDELDLSKTPILVTLKAKLIQANSIDLSENSRISTVAVWNEALESIYLPSEFAGTVDFADANADSYLWTVNDQTVGEEAALKFDGSDETRVATMTKSDGVQIVNCYVGDSFSKSAAPTDFVYSDYDRARQTLRLTWTAKENATQYEVQYKRSDDGTDWKEWKTAEIVETNERIATRVYGDSFYLFRVRAFENNGVISEWSEELAFKAEEPAATLAKPTEFQYGEYDADNQKLPLAWSAVEDATQYEVQYKRADSEDSWTSVWNLAEIVATNGRTATRVNEDSYYLFRVRALDDQGQTSEWSDELLFKATETLPLDAPTNFQYADYNRDDLTLKLSWSGVDDAVLYEVQYKRGEAIEGSEEVQWPQSWSRAETVADTSRTATRVYEDSYYQFRVRAKGLDGKLSDWSETLSFKADDAPSALEAPTNLQFADYNPIEKTLKISWSGVDDALFYETQYRIDSSHSWSGGVKTAGTSRVATRVEEGALYEFRVRSIGVDGERSEWSDVLAFQADDSTALLDAVFETLEPTELVEF